MALVFGLKACFKPLTVDVFEKGRIIDGEVTSFGVSGDEGVSGVCCSTGDEYFVHPTLFEGVGNWSWFVELRRNVAGEIEMWQRLVRAPGGKRLLRSVLPVEMKTIELGFITKLVQMHRHNPFCEHSGCDGAKGKRLDLKRSVLYLKNDHEKLLCGHCYDKLKATEPADFVVDGRTLPPQSPVPLDRPQVENGVEYTTVELDNVITMIQRQMDHPTCHRCKQDGAPEAVLDMRTTLLVLQRSHLRIICASCYETHFVDYTPSERSHGSTGLLVDGRLISPQSLVPIYNRDNERRPRLFNTP